MSASYRPDIDGLRAVAVIPVVLFHVGAAAFPGGFVGVDVFFVISGYLITSIILPEIDERCFSIVKFYQRRVRRIFPALVSVLLFCSVVGFVILTPSDYRSLGQSIIATAFFVSNIFFWRQTNYFAAPASENPLLHTWSLSIEEQFYLFYPLLLILLPRCTKTRISVLSIICAISFVAGAGLVFLKPSATFYLGPTRAWELLIGGLIALVGAPGQRYQNINLYAALSGAALIVGSMIAYSSSMRFPGAAALLPAGGAGLIIWSGRYEKTIVHRFLGLSMMTGVGKASYSLYLWHFPLIAFSSYVNLAGSSLSYKIVLCTASLVISFLSLRYVELPFRQPSPAPEVRRPVIVALSGMMIAFGLGLLIDVSGGFPSRLDQKSTTYLEAEHDRDRHHMECMTLEQKIIAPADACKLGTAEAIPHILLWGDSHAVVTASAIAEAAQRNNASLLLAASVDCPIGVGFGIDPTVGNALAANAGYQYCEEYNKEMLHLVETSPEITTVVLSSRWTNWRLGEAGSAAEAPVDIRLRDAEGTARTPEANKQIFVRGFTSLLRALTAAQKTVWVVGPLPEPSFRVPKALFIKRFGLDHTELDVPLAEFERKNRFILSTFADLQQKFPIRMIWPHLALCKIGRCAVSEEDRPLYLDDNHLSLLGAHETSYLYDNIFEYLRQAHRG